MQSIMQEVHRPQLTGMLGLWQLNAALRCTFSAPADSDGKLLFPVNPFSAFLVNDESLAPKKQMESAAAKRSRCSASSLIFVRRASS